jgi:hypothetical protein
LSFLGDAPIWPLPAEWLGTDAAGTMRLEWLAAQNGTPADKSHANHRFLPCCSRAG